MTLLVSMESHSESGLENPSLFPSPYSKGQTAPILICLSRGLGRLGEGNSARDIRSRVGSKVLDSWRPPWTSGQQRGTETCLELGDKRHARLHGLELKPSEGRQD